MQSLIDFEQFIKTKLCVVKSGLKVHHQIEVKESLRKFKVTFETQNIRAEVFTITHEQH